MTQLYDMIVVGAGPTGLTLAYELGRRGQKICVVEKADRIGGLSKSFTYGGNVFDIGPKRFHTDDEKVLSFIDHVLAEDKLIIGRSTKVFFANKFFNWPLSSKELIKLPPTLSVRCLHDLMQKREFSDRTSFESYIKFKYGNSLFETFFKPYTEKFLRIPSSEVHADWATTGINRSIIDKEAKGNSTLELLQGLLLPKQVDTSFIYPARGGFGGFWDKLGDMCTATGNVTFVLGTTIDKMTTRPDGLSCQLATGAALQSKKICWTGNLNHLLSLTSPDVTMPRLRYLNTIFYNLVVDEKAVSHHKSQWIYISKGDTLVSRITCMREFAPYTCVGKDYNIICEVTDSQATPVYFPQQKNLETRVVQELVALGFLKNSAAVRQIYINPQEDTYPIYHKNYLHDFNRARRAVAQFSKNILLLGRSGAFWYNNSDHSIRMALDTAENLARGHEEEFEYRNYFGGEGHKSA